MTQGKKKKKRVEFTRKKVKIKAGRKKKPKSPAVAKIKAESLAKLEKQYPIELMLTDWSVRYPELAPTRYLMEAKGYTDHEAKEILRKCPAADWYTARNELLDGVTAALAKRQIDWAAEMHDLHFEGSKIGLNSVMEWIREQAEIPAKERDIKNIKTALEAIQVAQRVQRTALGLPSDDGAIHVYQQLIMKQQQTVHISEDEKTPIEKLEAKLTYEEIQALIEVRRAQKAQEAIEIEASEMN